MLLQYGLSHQAYHRPGNLASREWSCSLLICVHRYFYYYFVFSLSGSFMNVFRLIAAVRWSLRITGEWSEDTTYLLWFWLVLLQLLSIFKLVGNSRLSSQFVLISKLTQNPAKWWPASQLLWWHLRVPHLSCVRIKQNKTEKHTQHGVPTVSHRQPKVTTQMEFLDEYSLKVLFVSLLKEVNFSALYNAYLFGRDREI